MFVYLKQVSGSAGGNSFGRGDDVWIFETKSLSDTQLLRSTSDVSKSENKLTNCNILLKNIISFSKILLMTFINLNSTVTNLYNFSDLTL